MFDIGWSELLVLGALALIVVGPKDLPGMLRTLGQLAGKARRMAREFQTSMEDAARDADMGKEMRDMQTSMADWNRKIGADAPRKYAEKFMAGDDKAASNAPVPTKPGPTPVETAVESGAEKIGAETGAATGAATGAETGAGSPAGDAPTGPAPDPALGASAPAAPTDGGQDPSATPPAAARG
ncbi:MAG: Sec-independent protein translocase protein TatB [Pseudomonadota bacterium]